MASLASYAGSQGMGNPSFDHRQTSSEPEIWITFGVRFKRSVKRR
jgi:hypothetical protein